MKRSFSALMVLVFLLHFAGFYLYFMVRLQSVRAEAGELLKSKPALQTIVLSQEAYQLAQVDDHEIEWQGGRYDIANITYQGDNVILKAVLDKNETELF